MRGFSAFTPVRDRCEERAICFHEKCAIWDLAGGFLDYPGIFES